MSEIMALTEARPSLPTGEEELKEKEAIANFITKVWKIVESPEYNKYIHWSDVSSPIEIPHVLVYITLYTLRVERRL